MASASYVPFSSNFLNTEITGFLDVVTSRGGKLR